MHFYPFVVPNLYEAMTAAAASGTIVLDSDDEAYQVWAQAMATYSTETNAKGLPSINFWLIVRVDAEGFSETVEMHPDLPMMMPRDGAGALIGIARTEEELHAVIEKDTDKYVYLTYKIKLQGQHAWRTLLEFMGEHNMLDKDN